MIDEEPPKTKPTPKQNKPRSTSKPKSDSYSNKYASKEEFTVVNDEIKFNEEDK